MKNTSRRGRRAEGRESWPRSAWKEGLGDTARHKRSSARIPRYAYQHSYRRVRDPTASEVAMSPGPACRHTHTRIYLIFPFYLFGLPLVEGHSSNPHGSVAIIGEHGGPAATARRPPAFLLARGLPFFTCTTDHRRASRCALHVRARHHRRCLSEVQRCSFDSRIHLETRGFSAINSLIADAPTTEHGAAGGVDLRIKFAEIFGTSRVIC